MSGNSASGGYVVPDLMAPGQFDLDVALRTAIQRISGLDPSLVRPRYDPKTPQMPSHETDWIAVGIGESIADHDAIQRFDPNANDGNGAMFMVRNERILARVSFYGKNGASYARRTRDGFMLRQNMDVLRGDTDGKTAFRFGLVEASAMRNAHELFGKFWYYRWDMDLRFYVTTLTKYDIYSLLSAQAGLQVDDGIVEQIVIEKLEVNK